MSYRMTAEPGLLRLVFFGAATHHDLQSLAVELAEAELRQTLAPNRLVDLRQITASSVTFVDMLSYVEQRRARTLANAVKTAIVVEQPVQLGYARMFQTLLDHPQIEVQIFSTEALAQAWLAEPRSRHVPRR